ncbi:MULTISPECIES: helix-turn-helix domain-containing protein [Stenotrophomonas]|uniref:Helix-turn-helix domain-containing protein n=1 Tax=Stenotrophomonas lactitubi TaxID=2045214 RepID=A0AAW4GH42_9GAMM|nr:MULTISPECIES: RodZ domain-containing protein [unclassified Stenotrophomonas]MBM9913339.1 helix-turn-helix domain-containing protein [Stenotrophomonas lactitubi]MBM9923225.1 helix-turn-helix domain-containing protein [Stenotrophomonas lactitubi]MBM9939064.1 helix-turn-helix domain-containing protein [Stenotrophomonas lactitubi]NYT99750.1 helix-turn-helix domain-containing protein [Stenotrophomonas sp. SbOxS2]
MIDDQTVSDLETVAGCGTRLRQAREAAGLTLEDVGQRLRMPVQVVKSLEHEQWQKLGAPVFVRGQLRSYARLLGVDVSELLEQAQVGPVVPPTLVSHTHTPRARRIAENLGRRALYVGITAVLAVPVWFATRGHFDGTAPSPNTASLDVIPAAVPVTPAGPGSAAAAPAEVAAAPVIKPTATPYVASLAPVPRAAPAPAANLDMQFSGDSWVDIGGPDGATVEKALIKSGESRSFTPGQVARVTLGNASAVQVQQNGAIVDLTPYQRANVARFQVSSEGSVVPVSH